MFTIGHSLHSAARDGNFEELCGLLREWKSLPTNPTDVQPEKRIIGAFMIAAKRGHTSCVRAFVTELGVDVDVSGAGRTALHNAAEEGHTDTVRCLVSEFGAAALSRSTYPYGYTALHFAAARGHLEVVSFLVGFLLNDKANHNASDTINVQCGYGATPLFVAAEAGQTRIVKWLLLQPGVDTSIANKDGVTSLHTASSKKGRAPIVRLLLSCCATAVGVNATTRKDEKTPLHDAVFSDEETVRILVEHGADPNALNSSGNTPLHCAACVGRLSHIVRYLVEEAGADVAIRNYKGQTALYLAADMRHGETTRVLVANRGVF